jgi:hypothetical protein
MVPPSPPSSTPCARNAENACRAGARPIEDSAGTPHLLASVTRSKHEKQLGRIRRQFDALTRYAPPARHVVDPLLQSGMRWVRVPAAVLFILGGMLAFLPVLGIWMIPLGLLLLAIDIPALRPAVAKATIRVRRFIRRFRRGPNTR